MERHTRQKLGHCCRYVAIAKLFYQKMFRLGPPDWSVRMEKISVYPHYRNIGRKVPDFGSSFEKIEISPN